ncbi:TIGR02647 family protein [Pseudomonas sp. A-1]|uniref:TIGR02647 family protein n=1 Tax=unclassified Pseudomonas TaxID=196821 RepID=UPI0010A65A65|nr:MULTISPECIES: TIGR02647 family protein [unclassified Pseudomonas]THG74932.1 TIGR02647 family protein [Pseudomonas sp. A-1]WPP44723.1 TIGR02647 family protein [Pseudomonas sp. AN-1]
MHLNPELIAELELLTLFNPDNTQEGLKIHQDAAPQMIAAGQRLHAKGLISQADGGYLTSLGLDATEQLRTVLTILQPA